MTLALALLALLSSAAAQEAPPPRVEAFVLEQVDAPAAGDLWTLLGAPPRTPHGETANPPEELGYMLWRRCEEAGARILEWDLSFSESHTRLLEVERRDAHGESLVYREFQPHSGRTLRADWVDDGATLRVREWGGRDGLQQRLEECSGGRLRLGLLEELREGAAPPLSVRAFDPLARRFEHLSVSVEAGAPEGPWAGARLVRLSRDDGSSAGAWLVRDGAVLAFQWQAGGLRARRIDLDQYRRRVEAREALREAAAAATGGTPVAAPSAGSE